MFLGLLVYRFVYLLTCCFVDLFVCWCVGVSCCLIDVVLGVGVVVVGLLVCWVVDALQCRCVGVLIC